MKRSVLLICVLVLSSCLACIAGTAKKPVKGHGNQPLSITNPIDGTGTILMPDYIIGQPFTYTFTATGGKPCIGIPYHWSVDPTGNPLPAGVVLDPDTGVLSGATNSSDFSFTVVVSDCAP